MEMYVLMKSPFLSERKIEVEETYNGETFKKARFIVIDPNSSSDGGNNQKKCPICGPTRLLSCSTQKN